MQNTIRKIWALSLAALLCCLVFAAPAYAAKRVALVIGNNTYENVPALQKAVNNSEAISQELAKLGFDVVSAENVGRRAMSRALVELESKIESGDTALIYFAGHGFAVDGTNYLLPGRCACGRPRRRGPCARCLVCRKRPLGQAAGEGCRDRDPHPRCLPRRYPSPSKASAAWG